MQLVVKQLGMFPWTICEVNTSRGHEDPECSRIGAVLFLQPYRERFFYFCCALQVSRDVPAEVGCPNSVWFDIDIPCYVRGNRGSTVVKVLCYKSEGRWFDPS